MASKVTFFDAHDGHGGAIIALPGPIRALVKAMEGQTIDLDEAVAQIRDVVESVMREGVFSSYWLGPIRSKEYLALQLVEGPSLHSWQLIRYRSMG